MPPFSPTERNEKVDALLGADDAAAFESGAGADIEPEYDAEGYDAANDDQEPEPTETPVEDARPRSDGDVDVRSLRMDREARRERAERLENGKAAGRDDDQQRMQSELQQLRAYHAQQEQLRQQEYLRQQQLAQQQQDPAPDYDEDPAGFLRWQNRQLENRVNQLNEWAYQRAQQEQQQAQQSQFVNAVQEHEDKLRREADDYDDAVEFMKNRREQELRQWGVMDPNQRKHIVQNEVMFLAQNALQAGRDPARAAYEMAKSWGYDGHRQDLERRTSAAKDIATAKKAKSSNRGKSKSRPLTLEQLADMEGPEFDKAWSRLFGSKIS